MLEKTCSMCKETKPAEDFYKNPRYKDNLSSRCKKCNAAYNKQWRTPEKDKQYNIKSKYGLSSKEFTSLLEEQDHKCAICRKPFTSITQAYVDHSHEFGYVRGILCLACNTGLGQFKDSTELLQKALDYLEEHEV